MRMDGDLFRFRINAQNVVAGVVGHKHDPRAVEANPVARASLGQCDPDRGFPFGGDEADIRFSLESDGVEVTVLITSGSFDASGERFLRSVLADLP